MPEKLLTKAPAEPGPDKNPMRRLVPQECFLCVSETFEEYRVGSAGERVYREVPPKSRYQSSCHRTLRRGLLGIEILATDAFVSDDNNCLL
ncbi:MAG: hypothetical protein KTU85_09790 [Acidimicrobiia bacterium]|nr:hypothetical protein [Acidimicrobiia bacterium]